MSERYSYLTHLETSEGGERIDPEGVHQISPDGKTLLARYDLAALRSTVSRDEIARRPAELWRYHELLPVSDPDRVHSLGEGFTPLVDCRATGGAIGVPRLLVKDESMLPTGTFKARGAAVGVARAAELGVTSLAMPTNGNAGAAWSAYCARYGVNAKITMPNDAPSITELECRVTGADVTVMPGTIADSGRAVAAAVKADPSLFDASTLREPYRVEGKKTMGLEIAEQLHWRMPDVIVYPTGGGVGLIGIYKAFRELIELGWIDDAPLPRFVSVQAEGCDPIVRSYRSGSEEPEPLENTYTAAFGVNVPTPMLGGGLVLDIVRRTGGTALTISDEQAMTAVSELARHDGMIVCPEAGLTLAAAAALRQDGWIDADEEVVLINTGAGTKYPEALASAAGSAR